MKKHTAGSEDVSKIRDVNKAGGAKAENATVNFRLDATVNLLFQFWAIFAILWKKNFNNIIMMTMVVP